MTKLKNIAKQQPKSKKSITPKELEKMWRSVDMRKFWIAVMVKVIPEVEAYERASALSVRGGLY